MNKQVKVIKKIHLLSSFDLFFAIASSTAFSCFSSSSRRVDGVDDGGDEGEWGVPSVGDWGVDAVWGTIHWFRFIILHIILI